MYWQLGDVERFLAENLQRARTFGVPDDAFAQLKQATDRTRDVYEATGLTGLRRFVADLCAVRMAADGA